jgi:thiol-disulfide isomerase/thioredoxin
MVTAKTRLSRLLAIAAAMACLAGAAPAPVVPGSLFPSLSGAELGGGPLPETAGQVVLVDFWASWCAPCKASFPAYSRLQGTFAGRGLVIIGISVDDNPSAYSAFVAKLKPAFATAHDSKHRLVADVQVPTMPTCYLIDRSGMVRFIHAGFHGDQTENRLRREIEALLEEKPAGP